MFINIIDSRDEITITVNTDHIVCIGPDTAHNRYNTLIELVNGKLIYSRETLIDVQNQVLGIPEKKKVMVK